MIVISDASPINILVCIGQVEILPAMFGRVIIPTTVALELNHANTPAVVRQWMAAKADWLEVRSPAVVDPTAPVRHRGEREAIQLAKELKADLLIIDERRPRAVAVQMGIPVIGTIGLLAAAADRGLIADLAAAFDLIRTTNFRVAEEILDSALARHLQRRNATDRNT